MMVHAHTSLMMCTCSDPSTAARSAAHRSATPSAGAAGSGAVASSTTGGKPWRKRLTHASSQATRAAAWVASFRAVCSNVWLLLAH